MPAYYNEIDPFAAAWLRNLIAAGHIAPGEVDERSILEVKPDDLRGFAQCHFFAGIGAWSHALRLAGVADSRPVWTGSCPCQPFSVAGAQRGSEDERHLWPAWFRLIGECRPAVVFGEQVAGAAGLAWLDHVLADLEDAGYAAAAANLCAAGAGAPHIRQRLYFVAQSDKGECRARRDGPGEAGCGRTHGEPAGRSDAGELADASGERRQQERRGASGDEATHGGAGRDRRKPDCDHLAGGDGATVLMGHPARGGLGIVGDASLSRSCGHLDGAEFAGVAQGDAKFPRLEGFSGDGHDWHGPGRHGAHAAGSTPAPGQLDDRVTLGDADRTSAGNGEIQRSGQLGRTAEDARPGATNGFWAGAEWIACRDGKARPVEPGTSPLAHGATNRVGRLRGYGNAICAPLAGEFIAAAMECMP